MKIAAIILCAWILATAGSTSAGAQSASASERQKIEALIGHIGDLRDAKIIRNGWSYEPATAVRFLRGKWAAHDAEITTVGDFIDKVASVSGTSGQPYLIRFKDGRELPSREFLLSELKKIEDGLP